jgi:hypothetical protein
MFLSSLSYSQPPSPTSRQTRAVPVDSLVQRVFGCGHWGHPGRDRPPEVGSHSEAELLGPPAQILAVRTWGSGSLHEFSVGCDPSYHTIG